MAETLTELQLIFRDVFDNATLDISRQSNAANVAGWDSLTHVNLIAAIEQHFGISFALGELEDLKNVGELMDVMQQKIEKRSR